jgi:hypoxanthine phosphoribosyltransferase
MERPEGEIDVLYNADEIAHVNARLARDIAFFYAKDFMIVALLKGSFVFAADLVRALHDENRHPQIDFMTLSSYGNATTSSGKMTVNRDLSEDVTGKDILLVDDILESGGTLDYARNYLLERGAKSIKICVLLDKPHKRRDDLPIDADFVGFSIEDHFVIGYGLDYAGWFRELPYIGVLAQS